MIPSVSPPFGMTRWVAQTQVSYVSATPYNASWALNGAEKENSKIHGFMGTRQPAIWMGESGSVAVVPGVGSVKAFFDERGLRVVASKNAGELDYGREEVVSPSYYNVLVEDGTADKGTILCEMSATSRVGHLRFTFSPKSRSHGRPRPYILIEAARPSIITSTPSNVTYPEGHVHINTSPNSLFEICGYSTERQDSIITPVSGQDAANQFKGYFCARFGFKATESLVYGTIQNGSVAVGPVLSAFVLLPEGAESGVDVRVGTSFISVEQARANVEAEVPDVVGSKEPVPAHRQVGTLEWTAGRVRSQWAHLADRVSIEVGGEDDHEAQGDKEVFWTGIAHSLQYPSEQSEHGRYWSGYDAKVHEGESYTGYSIWDTYRAIWALQIMLVPEHIPGMVRSMLQDFQRSGWLPMWKNVVETNIMVGTHADSLIAEAVLKGIPLSAAEREIAWDAVWKDATVPPKRDWELKYDDREEHVDYEVRAGLSSVYNVDGKGWVADDIHSESASRTLDYAYDDYAAYVLARELSKPDNVTKFLYDRAMHAPFTLFNEDTGFMEARNADGNWAGEDKGWTEGDKWAYSFDVVHNVPELIERRGGKVKFVQSLEEHFEGGHNDHTNEPSHHIPYLYALSGAAFKAQERIREIAKANYNNRPDGLTGNEDCGQMSAWYIFSAMGFYPVNPVSGEYVVGSPFFERVVFKVPNPSLNNELTTISIRAPGARTKPYIKSLSVNGDAVEVPVLRHDQLLGQSLKVDIVFEMSKTPEAWGNDPEVLRALGVALKINQAGGEVKLERDEL
ncbi:glycoside hydrolase family 92 protein [Ephemerocybe angulata]|uniref:Glycoside hydrolase family 92 protein n=1 Tax=Ephemerocybe angulata TaxID=980116 RepID=A0A8H6ME36_9AGAR|nr:glycoside hydrolase family 92 protein [Tulosesus angulatus]